MEEITIEDKQYNSSTDKNVSAICVLARNICFSELNHLNDPNLRSENLKNLGVKRLVVPPK